MYQSNLEFNNRSTTQIQNLLPQQPPQIQHLHLFHVHAINLINNRVLVQGSISFGVGGSLLLLLKVTLLLILLFLTAVYEPICDEVDHIFFISLLSYNS